MPTVIYHYTYLITNTTNQMQYIGVRSCSCLPENDSDYMGSSKTLDETMAVEPEAFTKTIIGTFPTREIANDDEQRLHKHYDVAKNPKFYNLMNAPTGFCNAGKSPSLKTRKKMSENNVGMKGMKHSKKTLKKMSEASMGMKHSKETRNKISAANSGENHYFYGKTHSPEARKKMSETHKNRKKPIPNELYNI